MLTIIIAVTAGIGVGAASAHYWGPYWGIGFGMVTIMVLQLLIGLWVRRKINAINGGIQNVLQEAQKHIGRKVRLLQQKPQGNAKTMQKLLEKDQEGYLRQVLVQVETMAPMCRWNIMLRKQMNTMKMIYNYQLRDFKKVDELMPKVMFFDPRAVAMKLARMYKNDMPGMDKFFRKKIRKFKDDNAVLIYAVYSWILMKRDRQDEATKVLIEAKNKTSNPVITANWEALVNGMPKKFSNAGLGDEWYALFLEEPKLRQQRMNKSMYQ
ncbi:MAG: hypothetical protein PHQ27_08025 [Victivallales bacterium]|nr:hypothetical protein [Victivallales bacterium]